MAHPVDAVMNASSKISHPPHPYYPLEVEITGYLANEWPVLTLLTMFFGGCAILFSATYVVVKRVHPGLRTPELFTIMWFVLSKAFIRTLIQRQGLT